MHKKNKNYWTFMFKYTNIELTVKRNKKQEGNKRMKGNVIVGQSGGPTAAINASLAGVYRIDYYALLACHHAHRGNAR